QAAVSGVAVSKPTTIRGSPPTRAGGRAILHPGERGPALLAFDEPGDLVLGDAGRGDLVDVERAFFGELRLFRAEVFLFRELHADRVFDFALQAFEEGALLALNRTDVGRFCLPREGAGDV